MANQTKPHRSAETIIADWIATFTGDEPDNDKLRTPAQMLIRWLRDEGWEITPSDKRAKPQ